MLFIYISLSIPHINTLRRMPMYKHSPTCCHDFLVILAMPTTCAHGTGVAIPLYSSYHTAITFEPLCSHSKPEGLTSSPLRGSTQWLVYNGTQWFRLYTTSPLRGSTRMLAVNFGAHVRKAIGAALAGGQASVCLSSAMPDARAIERASTEASQEFHPDRA